MPRLQAPDPVSNPCLPGHARDPMTTIWECVAASDLLEDTQLALDQQDNLEVSDETTVGGSIARICMLFVIRKMQQS